MKKKVKIRIGIVGISGRMGKSIAMAISKSSDAILTAGCEHKKHKDICLLYTSPSPRDSDQSRMPSSA